MGQQPPAPVIRRQDRQRLIHEHAAPARGGELAAVIMQVIERLEVVDQLPRLARSQNGRRERQGMERHVVFAHELVIGHVRSTFVGAPPALPCRIIQTVRIGPFGGAGDVFDGGIEPDVEHLALHPRPRLIAAHHRDAPMQIAGDAAILQPVAIVQPFLGDRGGQDRPVGLAVDPSLQLVLQRALHEVKVLGFPLFQIGGAGNRRARVDKVGRIQLLGAVVALVAARRFKPAVRAGAFDIAVGQEAAVVDRIDHLFGDFADQSVLSQLARKMLGQLVIALRGGSAEMVEGQAEALGNLGLNAVHFGAVFGHRLARLGRRQFGRGAVLIGRTDEHHLIADGPVEPREQVGRQLAAHKVAQMLDAVDIRNSRGDKNPCHGALLSCRARFSARRGRGEAHPFALVAARPSARVGQKEPCP